MGDYRVRCSFMLLKIPFKRTNYIVQTSARGWMEAMLDVIGVNFDKEWSHSNDYYWSRELIV